MIQLPLSTRSLATQSPNKDEGDSVQKPPGLFKRFKKMWKDYWYVMIPVHVVTSVGWLGGFYVMCKSGLDMPAILSALGASEAYLEKISQSQYTYIALSYACYKVATPVRYTVTIGGTTYAIRRLTEMGVLKTTEELGAAAAEMKVKMRAELHDKTDHIQQSAKLTWDTFSKKRKSWPASTKMTWEKMSKKKKS